MRKLLTEACLATPMARLCSLWLLLVVAGAFVGVPLSGWDPDHLDWAAMEAPPTVAHWFGTDAIGRDLFARVMQGAGVSLGAALVATTVSVLIGVPFGALAGFLGGRADLLVMRLVDALYAVPFVLVVILLVVVFGRQPLLLFAALGAVFWLDIARIVRGQTLRLRQEAFIEAARVLGARRRDILVRHVIPNVMGPAVVYATLTVPGVILAESFVSFLGLGVQEPQTSWGVLIADGAESMEAAPWALFFPALFLGLTVWCANMLGDRLRDSLDVRNVRRAGLTMQGYTRASTRGEEAT